MSVSQKIDAFFFARRSAVSFGLMRIVWAGTIFFSMLHEGWDIVRYYSDAGFLPRSMESIIMRSVYRFSIFDYVASPQGVMFIYLILLLSSLLLLLGVLPRLNAIVSVLLVFSFHERNFLPLAGGETVLRMIGFLLMISPGIEALSVSRLRKQWKEWRTEKRLLPPVTMPAWPKRLLLWQMMTIYVTSVWSKLLGATWRQGTAVGIALHHLHFTKLGSSMANTLSLLSPVIGYSTIVVEGGWIFMLVPNGILKRIPLLRRGGLRRLLIACSAMLHIGIEFMMIVGTFLYAMLSGLIGLLEEEDFVWIRNLLNHRMRGTISVLYDGQCGLCRRSIFVLLMLDSLKRLSMVDHHDAAARKRIAPDLKLSDLDKALHIRLPNGKTHKGFDALRVLAWHMPLLWITVPFLYLPGALPLGNALYARIAERRKACTHEFCRI